MTTSDGIPVGPLSGTTVVVTRARSRSGGLVDRLTTHGASVVELPVIAVADPVDAGAALAEAAADLVAGAYRWVVVTSPNGADRVVDALGGRRLPAGLRWAAVGPATSRSLRDGGIVADLVPLVAVSDALVDAFPTEGADRQEAEPKAPAHGRVLFVRAERVRDVVVPGLTAKGWQVDDVIGYRTVAGTVDRQTVDAARAADAVAFTSSSTVEHTAEVLGADGVPAVVVTIGPITSASVRAIGLEVAGEAVEHTLDGLVDALVAVRRQSGGGTPTT